MGIIVIISIKYHIMNKRPSLKRSIQFTVFAGMLCASAIAPANAALVAWDLNPLEANAPVGWSSNPLYAIGLYHHSYGIR